MTEKKKEQSKTTKREDSNNRPSRGGLDLDYVRNQAEIGNRKEKTSN